MTTAAISFFAPTTYRIVPGRTVERPVTPAEAAAHFNLITLDTLTTAHMTAIQQGKFSHLLNRVREWRAAARNNPGLSFMLMSSQVGIGKTHIARAVVSSYSAIVGDLAFYGETPLFNLERRARFYTARELINVLGGDNALPLFEIVPSHVNCLVLDDLGREGYLDYVKADQQQAEKQARYFHLINHLYERRNGRFPVSVFITTNLDETAVIDLLGAAVWSRLLEMCPRGYIVELSGLDDYRRVKSGR